jgi:hypothetical protein
MALGKAVVVGAVAALAVPYLMRAKPDALGGWLNRGVVHFAAGDFHFAWSWPLFCAVTLFAWAMLAWSNR